MALNRPAFDAAALNANLDIAAVNPYYAMQDALTIPTPPVGSALISPSREFGPRGRPPSTSRPTWRSAPDDEPFLVTETNATSIGWSHSNFPAYDGQWRQAAWALVARGARMVEYWHWHTNHFGAETYWQGVLNHDGEPGRCYDEVKRIAGELQACRIDGHRPRARRRRRLLYSPESKWALGFQPPLTRPGTNVRRSCILRADLRRLLRGACSARGLQAGDRLPGRAPG